MTSINWQQPFVNTFKHFTIASDKNVIKHGDITTILDNQIKSSVYKITGSSPMSNFINMPKLNGQSLGLNGRYIYFLFKPVPNKFFSIHIDIATHEKQVIRVSFSNLFKEFKTTSTWLQFPYVIQAPKNTIYEKTEQNARDMSGPAPPLTKWTILCIDLVTLLKSYSNRNYNCVRGFKLCANMYIKNVITSDILYEPGITHAEAKLRFGNGGTAFPRELSYPCEKYDNWHNLYDYVSFPSESFTKPFDSVGQSRIISQNQNINNNNSNQIQLCQTSLKYKNSQIDNLTLPNRFLNTNNKNMNDFNLPLVGVENEQIIEPINRDIHVYPFKTGNCLSSPSTSSSSSSQNDNYESILPVNNNSPNEIKQNEVYNYQTILEPDPIMELKKMIGLNCAQDSNVKWSKDCQYLIYGCQAIVVAYQINTGEQLCFVGHSERISCLAINPDNTILASGQTGPYSLIRLWNFKTRKCISILRNHDHSLYLLEFSSCGNYLCGVGRDKQSKSMLVLWDVSKSKNCKIIAKAHTDVHINRLIFIHFDSSRLITCGRDNVRFWRLKNDTLRSCAVNLMPYIHALNMNNGDEHQFLEFTDICMNARPDHNENLAYACTLTGQIFVFNLARMEIEHVRVLEPLIKKTGILNSSKTNHQLRLNSLTISDMFCTTGSDDGYVRIWPLDFSQVSVEAEHEAPIGLVRFSPDCLRIATVTLNGNLGVLDIKNKEYITLIRSHTNSIIDLDYDLKCKYMATASMDGTVRIWSYDNNCRQLYDFSAGNNEIPTCVSFYPKHTDQNDEAIFACGFNSGKIRIFNVSEAKLLKEINSPHFNSNKTSDKYEITDLKYSNEGKRLISGDIMKYLCLYDVDKDYCLIRMLPNSLSIAGSLKISPDSKNVAVIGSNNHLITVFESFNLNELLRIDISINNDSNEILTSLYNNYDRQEIGLKLEYAPYDLNQLLCITASKKLLKFDSKTGRLLSSITNICKSRADSICVSNDGKFLVTSGDNVIKIWDYEMRLDKNFQSFIGHSSKVNKVLFTPDNQTLISIGDSIIFWNFLAYKSTDEKKPNKMFEGRELEEMRHKPVCSILREKSNNQNDQEIFDFNEIKILNGKSFEKIMKNKNEEDKDDDEQLTEMPRTPPIAEAQMIHIETITANSEIEDTFLNDDLTIFDTTTSGTNNSISSIRKFVNLPNFVTSSLNLNTDENDSISNKNSINNKNLSDSFLINGIKTEKHEIKIQNKNKETKNDEPNVSKQLVKRDKQSKCARFVYSAPDDQCAIRLNSLIGYNGQYSTTNMIWSPNRELFAFTIGSIICIEDLKTAKQTILSTLHQEDITVLTLRNDCIHMASASGSLNKNQCQISIWDCFSFECILNLNHKNASNITFLNYSIDDRYLISISDYNNSTICIWNTFDNYSLILFIDSFSKQIINDLAWNPCKLNEFTLCGQNKLLITCSLLNNEDKYKLKEIKLDLPNVLCEQINKNKINFTSICYSNQDFLLYAATDTGFITVWSTKSNSCFLNWQADSNEIDVLICMKHNLITGSSGGSLKLWNVAKIHEMKNNSLNKASLRLDGITIDNEINLNNSIIKSCKFDSSSMDMGIVTTNKNTIWYVNWKEESSVRLVTTHMDKINQICFFNDKFLSTVSNDGSLNIWSIADRERLIQFEVKSPAICQTLVSCELFHKFSKNSKTMNPKNPFILVGYSDGYIRLFDIEKKNLIAKLKPFNHEITFLSYCKNTSFVLVGTKQGHIAVVDLSVVKTIKIIDDHRGAPITSLDNIYKPELGLTYWLAASKNKKLSIWCCNLNEDLYQMIDMLSFPSTINEDSSLNIPSLAQFVSNIDKNNKEKDLIAYVGYGLKKQILFYDFNKKEVIRSMDLSEWPDCMAISPNLSIIAFGTNSRLLQIKDFNQSNFQDYMQHSDSVGSVCFSNDGRKLFSTSYNEIFIWDIMI